MRTLLSIDAILLVTLGVRYQLLCRNRIRSGAPDTMSVGEGPSAAQPHNFTRMIRYLTRAQDGNGFDAEG